MIAILYTLSLFFIVNAEIDSTVNVVQSNLLTGRLWEVGSYLYRNSHKRRVLNIPTIRSTFYATPGIDFIIRDQAGNILFHSLPPWSITARPRPRIREQSISSDSQAATVLRTWPERLGLFRKRSLPGTGDAK